MTRSARRTVVVDQVDWFFDQSFRQFLWIANGRRGKDELRPGPIKVCNPLESANDVGNVRAEDTAIGVGFINDDISQAGKEVAPVGVMRQDTCMQHVGIGQNDTGILANG